MLIRSTLAAAVVATSALASAAAHARGDTGNVIFLHPDGTSASHWTAARMYWKGPDGLLNWDLLPQMAAYRGHMLELLTGTSNGGATTHAFGYRVEGLGSFGKDGNGNTLPPTDRFINALSGYPGSILREAANKGHPTGLVNDGNVGEPGTGAFAAEVGNRDNWNAIALQIIAGRDGAMPAKASTDRAPRVILGGGERNFLPQGTPMCAPASASTTTQQGVLTYPLNCMVHTLDWSKPAGTGGPLGIGRVATPDRTDARNLLAEAADAGYIVIRTRAEFAAVLARLESDRRWAPKILGLFAAHHSFNDRNEEELIASSFRNPAVPLTDKASNLVLFGNPSATDPGFNPPRGDELMRLAMIVLARHANASGMPYLLVAEPESTDNFGNSNNAIGSLVAAKVADDMIGVALDAQNDRRRDLFGTRFPTTIVTAADSDASGMQVLALPAPTAAVTAIPVNAAAGQPAFSAPLDGLYGRNSPSFLAAPDQFGRSLSFAIAWAGGPDFAGGILARASGNRGENRDRPGNVTLDDFSERFDNTDVYRFMYAKLFGRLLPPATTEAPTR
jgi:alkaline phosphatase